VAWASVLPAQHLAQVCLFRAAVRSSANPFPSAVQTSGPLSGVPVLARRWEAAWVSAPYAEAEASGATAWPRGEAAPQTVPWAQRRVAGLASAGFAVEPVVAPSASAAAVQPRAASVAAVQPWAVERSVSAAAPLRAVERPVSARPSRAVASTFPPACWGPAPAWSARFEPATARWRIASLSGWSWQAARDEGLS